MKRPRDIESMQEKRCDKFTHIDRKKELRKDTVLGIQGLFQTIPTHIVNIPGVGHT